MVSFSGCKDKPRCTRFLPRAYPSYGDAPMAMAPPTVSNPPRPRSARRVAGEVLQMGVQTPRSMAPGRTAECAHLFCGHQPKEALDHFFNGIKLRRILATCLVKRVLRLQPTLGASLHRQGLNCLKRASLASTVTMSKWLKVTSCARKSALRICCTRLGCSCGKNVSSVQCALRV